MTQKTNFGLYIGHFSKALGFFQKNRKVTLFYFSQPLAIF
jgi:hypothetical protein